MERKISGSSVTMAAPSTEPVKEPRPPMTVVVMSSQLLARLKLLGTIYYTVRRCPTEQ